jgi:hypothetical protein
LPFDVAADLAVRVAETVVRLAADVAASTVAFAVTAGVFTDSGSGGDVLADTNNLSLTGQGAARPVHVKLPLIHCDTFWRALNGCTRQDPGPSLKHWGRVHERLVPH